MTRTYILFSFFFLILYSTSLATATKIRSKTFLEASTFSASGPFWDDIHIGKTRGKTCENPQTRRVGVGLARVWLRLPGPLPHVPYP